MVNSATGEAESVTSPSVCMTGAGSVSCRPDDTTPRTIAQGMGLSATPLSVFLHVRYRLHHLSEKTVL
jgi:hypothetical protein